MNIRKFWRLCCLTVASFFWASCGSDVNPQIPMPSPANPDSSSDLNESSSSEESSSSVASESSSSEVLAVSSAEVESSSSHSPISSSSSAEYVLARDPSVSCESVLTTVSNPSCERDCSGSKKYLSSDMTISEKILTEWEEKLESCEAIPEMSPLVYGIETPSCSPFVYAIYYKCSNDSTYMASNCRFEDNLIYTSRQEYNEAHGISSSSVAQSSSSAEDLVKNCPQGDFALFVDILADVHTTLYEKFSKQLEKDSTLTDEGKKYLESLLDRENKTLKGRLTPYLPDYYYGNDSYGWKMSLETDLWFNGYIAKTKTCEDGTPVITERYQQKYDAILAECIEIIENEVKAASAEE